MNPAIELLVPAGDLEKLKYGLAYGADAVYAGVPRYSLRARENGFTTETIEQAITCCHDLNKKIYLTLNIFPHNSKLESFKNTLSWMSQLKPDALILSDPGVIMLAKELCPHIPIHLSTQANTVNWASVRFWKELGVKRIILSRELSITEIKEIRHQVPGIELECFVHGSICVAYSGRCLLSNYFNYRDPNQGTCTNSCRWSYRLYQHDRSPEEMADDLPRDYFLEETERPGQFMPIDEDEHGTYIMNSKDLCAIYLLDKLAEAGIDSFKIEGRSKSVYYVSVVTRAYRQALDDFQAGRPFNAVLEKEIFTVANREYITGFLERNPGWLGENYLDSRPANCTHQYCGIVRSVDSARKLMTVSVRNRFQTGDELELITPGADHSFTVESIFTQEGDLIQTAHGGSGEVLIPYRKDPGEFALLRRKITATVSKILA
jgi:putative protease